MRPKKDMRAALLRLRHEASNPRLHPTERRDCELWADALAWAFGSPDTRLTQYLDAIENRPLPQPKE